MAVNSYSSWRAVSWANQTGVLFRVARHVPDPEDVNFAGLLLNGVENQVGISRKWQHANIRLSGCASAVRKALEPLDRFLDMSAHLLCRCRILLLDVSQNALKVGESGFRISSLHEP